MVRENMSKFNNLIAIKANMIGGLRIVPKQKDLTLSKILLTSSQIMYLTTAEMVHFLK